MRILIGVDDSPHSKAAVEFVRSMGLPKGTQVMFVSVVQPVVLAYSEIYVSTAVPMGVEEELTRTHRDIATHAGASLRDLGLSTESRVLHGDPRIVLVEAARDERADLLVVGSHGRTGITKLVMGSVASHVVTHAPCSVLVVKLGK